MVGEGVLRRGVDNANDVDDAVLQPYISYVSDGGVEVAGYRGTCAL